MNHLTFQEIILVVGRAFIAFYFLKAGYSNILNFANMQNALKNRGVPLPKYALSLALFLQIGGGLSLMFNFYALIGVIALIIFTVGANFYFCRYWLVQGPEQRFVRFLFYANLAVIGGLLIYLAVL